LTDATPTPDPVPEAQPGPRPSLRALREEMAERNRRLAEEADADKRRDAALTALRCVGWMVLGVGSLLWSFHTTDMAYGRAAFYAGLGLGNGGIIFTLLGFYRRGEARGDW
jgi:hypothetical protein